MKKCTLTGNNSSSIMRSKQSHRLSVHKVYYKIRPSRFCFERKNVFTSVKTHRFYTCRIIQDNCCFGLETHIRFIFFSNIFYNVIMTPASMMQVDRLICKGDTGDCFCCQWTYLKPFKAFSVSRVHKYSALK